MHSMYPFMVYLIPFVAVITYFVMAYGRKIFLSRIYRYRHTFATFIKDNYKWRRDIEWFINYVSAAIIITLILVSATVPYIVTRQYVLAYQQAETMLSIRRRVPVVIAFDYSGSMIGEKINTAFRAIREYIDHVSEYVLIGLIPFNDHLVSPLAPTSNRSLLENTLIRLEGAKPFGSTIYSKPLQQALEWLIPYTAFNITPFVVFVTDGLPSEYDMPSYRSVVYQYAEYGIPIYPILIALPGEEDAIAKVRLSEVAELTNGKLYTAEKISELVFYFKRMAELTIEEVSKYVFETTVEYPFESRFYLVHEYIFSVLVIFSIYSLARILVYKITF